MNQLATVENAPRRAIIEVQDPIPLLDTSQFEHMQRIATVMAKTSLIPESLYMEKDSELPFDRIISNCFLVVNQAVRWGMDPFAVAQCVAVVKGKLCYEGKLVAAVIDAKIGVRLQHHFTGEGEEKRIYLCDRPFDDVITINDVTGPLSQFLTPGFRHPGFRLFDGSVAEWKTTGNGSPWTPKNHVRMLIYRGTRDWTRIYESAIMLGVYTPDEMLDLSENVRALRAKDVADRPSLADRLAAARTEPQGDQRQPEGFDAAHVTRETAALTGEPASGQTEPEQEPSSVDIGDDAGSGGVSSSAAAADPSDTEDGVEAEAGAIEAQEEPDASSASEPISDQQFLIRVYETMQDCVGPSVEDFNQAFKIFADELASASDEVKRKAENIRASLEFCCGEKPMRTKLQARSYLAGIIGVDEKELG